MDDTCQGPVCEAPSRGGCTARRVWYSGGPYRDPDMAEYCMDRPRNRFDAIKQIREGHTWTT